MNYSHGVCSCCLSPDKDLWDGLCHYCQPCPACGLMETDCTDEVCWTPVEEVLSPGCKHETCMYVNGVRRCLQCGDPVDDLR